MSQSRVGAEQQRGSALLEKLFGLRDETVLGDFGCTLQGEAPVHGRVFVSESAMSFSGGGERGIRRVISFSSISRLERRTVGLFFAELVVHLGEGPSATFSSFFHGMRDRCHALCVSRHAVAHPEVYAASGQAEEPAQGVGESPGVDGGSGGELVRGEEDESALLDVVSTAMRAVSSGRSFDGSEPSVSSGEEGRRAEAAPREKVDLGEMEVVLDGELPCAAWSFFDEFLEDEATAGGSLVEFHRSADTSELWVERWSPDASAVGEREVVRSMRYRMHNLPRIPMLPPSTRVEKISRARRWRGDVLTMDVSAKSFDVPMGDYFVTEDRWLVEPVAPSSSSAASAPRCRVRVGTRVVFSSYTILQSSIVQNTVSGSRDFHCRWFSAAIQHLQLPRGASSSGGKATAAAATPATPTRRNTESDVRSRASTDTSLDEDAGTPLPVPAARGAGANSRKRLLADLAAANAKIQDLMLHAGGSADKAASAPATPVAALPWFLPSAIEPLLPPPPHNAPRAFTLLLVYAVLALTLVDVVLAAALIFT